MIGRATPATQNGLRHEICPTHFGHFFRWKVMVQLLLGGSMDTAMDVISIVHVEKCGSDPPFVDQFDLLSKSPG